MRILRAAVALLAVLLCCNAQDASGNEVTVVRRNLAQFSLSDVLLVSTLDGSLQAHFRDTGGVLWTLKGPPIVEIQETPAYGPSFADNEEEDDAYSRVLWLAEPSQEGALYFFTSEGGIEQIPLTVQDLVQRAPFGTVENIVYTGSRNTTLHAIDIQTGEILQTFGSCGEAPNAAAEAVMADPSRIIMVGRTEYTLDMHERLGSPGWRVKIAVWTPNMRDQDLASQYLAPLDALYLVPLTNTSALALAENDMRPQRWVSDVPSLVIDVFDVLQSNSDRTLALIRQPPLRLSERANRDLYVTHTDDGSAVVVRGELYSVLLSSMPSAGYCDGDGTRNGIFGVHPAWCQGKRRTSSPMPLLPHNTESTPFPRLDPPREAEPSSRWWVFVAALVTLVGGAVSMWAVLKVRGRAQREPKQRRKRGTRGGKRKAPERSAGPITVSDVVLGHGSHGTAVYKGRFENRDVAVKRMLLDFYDVASQEVDILSESDDHPNVVRYFCKHETTQFLYIALELCPGTLEEVVRGTRQFSIQFDPLDALRQVANGLQHLHNLQIVHRDIKPQNILVSLPRLGKKQKASSLGVRYLISDFGLCRKLEGEQSSFLPTASDSVAGTAGWAAPEISVQHGQRLTRAVDIFSMGCLFYYVLTGGKHPFGEMHMRQANIQQRRLPVLSSEGLMSPEALDLIRQMLSFDAANRPTINEVLNHPIFWSDQLKLDFLVTVSDRLEHESREPSSALIDRLETRAADVVGADWHAQFPQIFVENLGKYRRYHGDRILDLLRALRNKLHHYNDFSPELKQCVGAVPGGYLRFFTDRFPALLMAVYDYASQEFSEEDTFAVFFDRTKREK